MERKPEIIGNGLLIHYDYKNPEINKLMAEVDRLVLRLYTLQNLMDMALGAGEEEIAHRWAKMEREASLRLEYLHRQISNIKK
jgi:hypothetical protein